MSESEPLKDIFDRYLSQIPNERTRHTYRWALESFTRYLDGSGTDALTMANLRGFYNWLNNQEYSWHTVETYVATVRHLLKWMDAEDLLPDGFRLTKALNMLSIIRGNHAGTKYRHRRPDPDLPQLVSYYDDLPLPEGEQGQVGRMTLLRNRALVHTLYASGGRISEVLAMTRDMVMDGRLDEAHVIGKGGYTHVIFLTPEAMRAIRAYCKERGEDGSKWLFVSHGRGKGKQLGRGTGWRVVKDAAEALDLHKSTSPHSFRHFRATQLLNEGMPLESVQAYLGHQDIATTRKIYAHTRTAVLKDQLATFGRSHTEAIEDAKRQGA